MEGENALSYFHACLGYWFGHFRVSLHSDSKRSEREFIAQQTVNTQRGAESYATMVFWIEHGLFRLVWLHSWSSFCCSIPCDGKSLGEEQFKAALQRWLSEGFQSVLSKKEFLILLNIHILTWGEPSFPSISVASTCKDMKNELNWVPKWSSWEMTP